jgi:hypothetical protein
MSTRLEHAMKSLQAKKMTTKQGRSEIMKGLTAKEELEFLSTEMQSLGDYDSRLEAVVAALRIIVDFRMAAKDVYPPYPPAETILRAAIAFDDWGFTLNELIEEVGPSVIIKPRRYKNALSDFLRAAGFTRRQIWRRGERPIAWFPPEGQSSSRIQ